VAHAGHRVHYTFEEYIAFEEASTVKHEYLDGQIYGMAGGTPEHGALKVSLVGTLFAQLLGGRCRAFDSDVRIRVLETGLATYPDASVVCGPRELDPADKNTIVNPVVLIEVTSKSTEEYDRGEKFDHYRRIPSLQEYILVSHSARAIEVRRRSPAGAWETRIFGPGERADLRAIACTLDVNAIYDAAAEPAA
jgi:Uma2 family endonuclease